MEHSYYDKGREPQEYMVPLSRGGGQRFRSNANFPHHVGSPKQGIPMHPNSIRRTPPTTYGGKPQPLEVEGKYGGGHLATISHNAPGVSQAAIDHLGSPKIPPSSAPSESQYSNEKQSSDFSQDGEIEPIVLWNVTLPLALSRYEEKSRFHYIDICSRYDLNLWSS